MSFILIYIHLDSASHCTLTHISFAGLVLLFESWSKLDNRQYLIRQLICFSVAVLCCMVASSVVAQDVALERPADLEFVRDNAGMIDEADSQHIREICRNLLAEKATPIIVVTIDSMAKHGGKGQSIEKFATQLFDRWQIGHARLGKTEWNTGILLLISKGDRKARIELGAGWGRSENVLCQSIMDDHIIYHFKQGNFSTGIVAGVEALDKMGRKLTIPSQPRPWWHYAAVVGAIGLGVFTIVSLQRSGANGWAWLFWGVVFSIIGLVLYNMLTSSSNSSSGGFGSSYGGGSSGGGGATGSW